MPRGVSAELGMELAQVVATTIENVRNDFMMMRDFKRVTEKDKNACKERWLVSILLGLGTAWYKYSVLDDSSNKV